MTSPNFPMRRLTPPRTLLALAFCAAFSGCSLFESDGQVTLSVTDAPVDGVERVVVQFSRVTFVSDDDESGAPCREPGRVTERSES